MGAIATAVIAIGLMIPCPSEIACNEPQTPSWEPLGVYEVTAYSYMEGNGENYETASGATPTPYYTVAETAEYPLGTILFIEGIGKVRVQDRGNFPQGCIDLHIGYDDPEAWGRQKRKVWRIKNE